jgi:hypothetical protein
VTRAGGKTACPSTIPDRGMNRSSRPPPARSTPGADRCFAPGHGEAKNRSNISGKTNGWKTILNTSSSTTATGSPPARSTKNQ